ALRHPNIARILDIGTATWNGQVVQYVVCENLTGGSLRDLRDRGRLLSPSQIVMVGLDVCRGLDVAHRAGLVHGDIRPANLVFGDDGKLRITDLGLAELVSDEIWSNPAAVSMDRAKYASPEQAAGDSPVPKSDVYSLCLCLLEAVTGQLPFIGDSTVATLSNRIDRLMPVSADLGPLAAVLERAGRPHAIDRSSAAELGRGLVQAAERLPRPAPIALLSTGLFAEAPPADSTAPTGQPRRPLPPVAEPVSTPTLAMPEPAPPPAASVAPTVAMPIAPVPATTEIPVSTSDASGPVPAPTQVVPAVDIPPPPQPDPPLLRHSGARRRLLSMLAIVVVAAALGGALAWFLGRDQSNEVPDLVGIEYGEALNMISEFGWNIATSEEPSDDIQDGAVLRTEPAAGAMLKEGDNFLVVLSTGPAPRTLPELVGLTVEQATAQLDELDLVIEEGDPQPDDAVPEGQIISWTVPAQSGLVAGDTVMPNTTVRVVVSTGPAPRILGDYTGRALSDVVAEIQGMSLVVNQAPDEFSDTIPIGGVVRQDPAPGTALAIGDTVTIVASKGSEFVAVPPLANLTVDQANAALTAAGLVLGQVKGDPTGINVLAEVGGVSIGADAVFPRGTAIDLTFAQPPPPPTEAPTTVPGTTVPPA
ncbi:MAG: PASTA domain-containing protein, partial [Ilumatobacteraceae bacterium]